ncbi:hypothetical protein EOD39_8983 [Acipenser ruthenus]|uniref:Uncharacterized protein n=1 Tax=Acipenser ruthenus TaxID=7906 RepID=A0A662YV97_ACIRT|nr:hypothetical protein EOD39_8983 [Acipenser ruthenus]
MVEMAGWQTVLQAEGQYIIIVKGEEEMAGTSSPTGVGGAQVHIKKEATSPPDTRSARQEVNQGAYYHQLQYDVLTNGWGPAEKAGQLAAALEGEVLHVLLDLGPDKMVQHDVLATALERRFGRVEPAVDLTSGTWPEEGTPISRQPPKRTWPWRPLSVD